MSSAPRVLNQWPGVIAEFRPFLAGLSENAANVTLQEGNTPLIALPRVGEAIGASVYAKFEGLNPTGSFKDRGMCVAVAQALAQGSQAVVCASTGNTAASAAAYAARAGVRCGVILPEGQVALGKLSQALIHGATVIPVRANFDVALLLARQLADQAGLVLVNSVNPLRIQGQKTVAFEVVSALGRAPDIHCLPVGNAGNITAAWLGYREMRARSGGGSWALPQMWGAQAAGAAPIVTGHVVDAPETIASAIRIGNPASWAGAVSARDESGGTIEAVTDDEILSAYRYLAAEEGVFCEPASAAGVALLMKKAHLGEVPADCTVVVTLTGHGLKDPDRAIAQVELPSPVDPSLDAVAARLGL